jgi:hypothetical protein
MSALFKKSVKGKKISADELESLNTELDYAQKNIDSISTVDLSQLRPSVSALLFYASQSEDQKIEFQEFVSWVKQPDGEPQWSEIFEELIGRIFGDLQIKRVGSLLEKINIQKTLTDVQDKKELVSSLNDSNLTGLYENKVDELGIDFNVNLLPFKLEVLDPRIVTVKPGKANEMHRHAHETVFIFLKGHGKVIVDNYENEVGPGDFALIPRWCVHQSVNLGTEDLVFLAVADFGLTGKSFMGIYSKTARLKRDIL